MASETPAESDPEFIAGHGELFDTLGACSQLDINLATLARLGMLPAEEAERSRREVAAIADRIQQVLHRDAADQR